MRNVIRLQSSTERSTMYFYQAALRPPSGRSLARAIIALALIGLPSMAMGEDTVKLSPEQATSLGVRVVHPVASPTDKTLPYPAQIVIAKDHKYFFLYEHPTWSLPLSSKYVGSTAHPSDGEFLSGYPE